MGVKLEKDPEEEAVDPTEYRRMVGSLRYLCNTRPYISYSVGVVNRYMQNPRVSHLNAIKRILIYLKGTTKYGIVLPKGGSRGEVESLLTQTQIGVETRIEVEGKVRLLVDNKSVIDLTKHPASHGRSKHIETRFHFIREQVSKGKLEWYSVDPKTILQIYSLKR
ncbi:uncharacterized protein LOC106763714 [Vigna radiata var. radiata]|uniref:Uncharacterized protein LOC106763714 n=1 Tax=Vigna radiata var. radiata TaxID=3916 RepID=A0A1S3UBH4_VIGRR|nr:uncharacterized protein LOC106763714 [Vigna radiata var. radiata]